MKAGLNFGSRRSGEHDQEDLQTPKVYLFGTRSVPTSFKKCGISNALDGTEDDLVWEEEEDSSQVEEEPNCDVYDDRITPEQWQELFGESDDEEEFHGF